MIDSKLHVLIIPAWMPKANDEAAGTFILQQAIALQRTGQVDVGWIFLDSDEVPRDKKELLKQQGIRLLVRKVSYIPKVSGMLIRRWCGRYYELYQQYVARHGIPDLIHAHSYVAGFAAAYISEQTGLPFVLTEHSTNFLNNSIRRLQAASVRTTLDQAAWIIAVGGELAKALEHWTTHEIDQIPNPIDPDIFYHDPAIQKANDFTLVAVGSLIPRKRMHLILEAMHLLPDEQIRFICIGNGPERKRLEKLSRKYGLQGRVTWHRFLPSREIARVLRQSHLLVSTSERETFGIVVAEAMMCGTPVLCTASGGPEEFVTPGCGRVVPVTAPVAEIAATIKEMITNYGQYQPEVNAAQTAAQFSQDKVMQRIIDGYQHVLTTAP